MMKKICLALLVSVCCLYSFSQDTARANELIQDGIAFHDNSQYKEAIAKYREALAVMPGYPHAMYELSYTYFSAGRLDSSIILGEQLLAMPVSEDIKRQVYVTLGSVYDDNKQPGKAEDIYRKGIKEFPDFYLLYFNLGVTKFRYNASDVEEAQALFEKALSINPFHAGSHYMLFRTMENDNRVAAMLSASMLCILEKRTNRTMECASYIQKALIPKIESDSGKRNVTIYLPMHSSKSKENDFSASELGLSLLVSSPELTDSLQMKTPQQKLNFQMDMLCNMIREDKKNKGFFWKYYAPFFSDLKKQDYTDVLVNRILCNSETSSEDWLISHEDKVKEFYNWVKNYSWYKQK